MIFKLMTKKLLFIIIICNNLQINDEVEKDNLPSRTMYQYELSTGVLQIMWFVHNSQHKRSVTGQNVQ